MSKTMDALKVHEFAHDLFNHPLQNEWPTMGIAWDRGRESTVVSKSKPSGIWEAKTINSVYNNFHPCMVLNTSRVLATEKNQSSHNLTKPFWSEKNNHLSWSSLIYKLCFPCFSFPRFLVRPSGADGIMATVGNIDKLPISWPFGTFFGTAWVEWLAPQETHAPTCNHPQSDRKNARNFYTDSVTTPQKKTLNKQLSTGVT